ncbi:MAG TPA: non-homologous end-joining DNA ligase [Bosea sp. (in: a-proteobacteria)]|uniref:non-homologous end-joining DNA ligase n=1 Tax=Bosea sp. (in: a-proteobacteria) TaxID=1871050 RepID=UPI002E11250D|nr:non-homologous end-joining DNA ligase [Bosea sp. (in: a-proteobacteria)]
MVRRPASRRALKAGLVGETLQSAPVAPARSGVSSGDLFTDPMPARVEPCLALLMPKPPEGPDWAFEVKWDGYRLAIHRQGTEVRVITRGGHDWTHRFPTIAEAAAELPAESFILDGEAVVLDESGRSDFGALQQALGGRGGKASAHLAILYAFDLLYLDGHDLTRMSLDERRQMLEFVLAPSDEAIRLSEEVEADGARFLEQACEMGLEGIIAKRRSAPYRPGRGGDWLKIKCVQSETFLIIGYEPSAAALGGIGRLLLAAHGNYGLAYVGSVGTGFTQRSATDLRKQLDRLKASAPPARGIVRKGIIWTKPQLAAEIAFRGWTHDEKLRHASFKGLRDKADGVAIYRLG